MSVRALRSRISVLQARIWGSVFLVLGVLVILGGFLEGEPATALPYGIFALLGAWMIVRGSRMGVETTGQGVAIVNFSRIHHHRWREIERFETDWSSGPRVHVVLKNGSKTRVQGIGGWVWTKPANWPDQEMVDELNELLSQG